ncbi:unnamed protein product [Rhodiola kirilowii]
MENVAISSSNPPLHQTLFEKVHQQHNSAAEAAGGAQTELPVIDISPLMEGDNSAKVAVCKKEIAKASTEWGFFQVVNHGIPCQVLGMMMMELEVLFNRPLEEKKSCMEAAGGSYRWGAPPPKAAGASYHLSWPEAFHIPISHLFTSEISAGHSFRSMEQYTRKVTNLASKMITALADELGQLSTFFDQTCNPGTSFMRLNKYPPCPIAANIYGLMPHTDSDFITVLHQDQVGGLQVMKDGEWFSVKPNPAALVVNIGDLLQAWSNDVYNSVKHRVVTNQQVERYSAAYFMCPLMVTEIESVGSQPQVYRKFRYGEYRDQVDKDVRQSGDKVGLARFLASTNN